MVYFDISVKSALGAFHAKYGVISLLIETVVRTLKNATFFLQIQL